MLERIGTHAFFLIEWRVCTERIGTCGITAQFTILTEGMHGTYRNIWHEESYDMFQRSVCTERIGTYEIAIQFIAFMEGFALNV